MPGDLKGQFQTGKILGVFNRHDGLARNPDGLGQIFLGHLVRVKPQSADLVGYSGTGQCQNPRR